MTGDQYTQCEAMMHLETVLGLLPDLAEKPVRDEVNRRIWAALYLVQSMGNGSKPENFAKVLEEARWYDARNETIDVINEAKRSLT